MGIVVVGMVSCSCKLGMVLGTQQVGMGGTGGMAAMAGCMTGCCSLGVARYRVEVLAWVSLVRWGLTQVLRSQMGWWVLVHQGGTQVGSMGGGVGMDMVVVGGL